MNRQEIDRVKRLIETPMDELRVMAFDGGDEQPSQSEANRRFQGWSKADLIEHILEHLEGYTLDE